jgi:hypothetical protein
MANPIFLLLFGAVWLAWWTLSRVTGWRFLRGRPISGSPWKNNAERLWHEALVLTVLMTLGAGLLVVLIGVAVWIGASLN